MFNKKKKRETITYNAELEQPAVKTSICTGEQVAGFMEKETRHFRDVMLIRSDRELADFCEACGVKPAELKSIV